jgi:hypothetical protein
MKALAVIFFAIAALCSQAVAQSTDAAKLKVLTSRMVDVVNQTNKLTAQLATIQAQKLASDQELVKAQGDLATITVFLHDYVCKYNKHIELVTSQDFARLITTNQLVINRLACDGVSTPPSLPEKVVTPSVK